MPRLSGRVRGLGGALGAAVLWGLSGTAAQVLFQRHHVSPQWLVAVRMLGAGLILYVVLRPRFPKRNAGRLVVVAIFGLAAVQYTYFAAIAYSNVATATFLQYTCVPMVAIYEMSAGRHRLTPRWGLAIMTALAGTALLVFGGTQGRLALHISTAGLVFGILSALTAAYYVLSSVRLVKEVGPWTTLTWGFLIGGTVMSAWAPPWLGRPTGSPLEIALLIGFVVFFGTLCSFGLFLSSLRHISASEASVASTIEPVSAAVASLAFLGVVLTGSQYLGGVAIAIAVVLLSQEQGVGVRAAPEPAAALMER